MNLIEAFYNKPWAMRAEVLSILSRYITADVLGLEDTEASDAVAKLKRGRPAKIAGSIGVLPVRGVINHRADFFSTLFGDSSIERLSEDFEAMVQNPNIGAIVLDIDSPGGSVSGVMEFAHQIQEAKSAKKIIAVANTDAASAAYWIASAAEELVVAPSGSVGSIGVFMTHFDMSERYKTAGINATLIKAGKYKAEGNPFQPLSEEAHTAFQADVDVYYAQFVKAVAAGRGVKASDVKNGFGQGRMVMSEDAVAAGMADRVATLADTLKRLGVKSESDNKFLSGGAETPEIEAVSDDEALHAELRQREIDMS